MKVTAYLNEKEFAEIDAVCERLGMKPGAWIAELAVRYARGQVDPLPADWRDALRELISARTDVVRAGTVANQIAKHANATGEFEDGAGELIELVRRLLQRADGMTEQASDRVGRSR